MQGITQVNPKSACRLTNLQHSKSSIINFMLLVFKEFEIGIFKLHEFDSCKCMRSMYKK